MRLKIHAMAALFAFSASVGACSDGGQPAQSEGLPPPPAQGADGGFGPFGPETPPTNGPQGPQQPFPQPMQPTGPQQGPQPSVQPAPQPVVQGGGEGIVSGAGGGVPAEFQTLMSNILDNYVTQIAPSWSRVPSVPDVLTGVNLGGEHVMQVALRGGQNYIFIGACDNECNNVDLVLQDASGAVIDSDVLEDDYPVVQVTPPANSVYTLRIQLKTCTIAPCYVGARLLRE